jgi:Uma2 family endonuclease
MGEPARRLATWEDLLRTPDDGRVWEVLGGSLEAQPRTRPGHGRVQARLSAGLSDYWIVDPEERTLEAFEARGEAWVRLGAWTDSDSPRIAPFDAIALDVGGLFPPLG